MLEEHGSARSTRSSRLARLARQSRMCRVESSRAKWNLSLTQLPVAASGPAIFQTSLVICLYVHQLVAYSIDLIYQCTLLTNVKFLLMASV